MVQLEKQKKPVGFTRGNEPRPVGEILQELVNNGLLFKDYFPNTELGIDLKLFTSKPGRLDLGDSRFGALVRDGEDHYTFAEHALLSQAVGSDEEEAPDAPVPASTEASEKKGTRVKRNPIIIPGNCVNLHRKDDGTLYLAFRRPVLSKNYSWKSFCIEAAKEILSLTSLGEEAAQKG